MEQFDDYCTQLVSQNEARREENERNAHQLYNKLWLEEEKVGKSNPFNNQSTKHTEKRQARKKMLKIYNIYKNNRYALKIPDFSKCKATINTTV